jgi:hypothetical protein
MDIESTYTMSVFLKNKKLMYEQKYQFLKIVGDQESFINHFQSVVREI